MATKPNDKEKNPVIIYLPSVDTELRLLAYETKAKALAYAKKNASMSCGAVEFVELKFKNEILSMLEDYAFQMGSYEESVKIKAIIAKLKGLL